MNDVVKVNRQFRWTLILFIVMIVTSIAAMILANLFMREEYQYIVHFAVLLFLLFSIIRFKNRFDQITNISYIIKIRSHAGQPIKMMQTKKMNDYPSFLQKKDYVKFAQDKDHCLFYRITQDEIKKIFRKHILEVVVILNDTVDGFYLDQVNEEIGKIQQQKDNMRFRMDRLLITQMKPITDLTEKVKDEIKEIIFVKTTGISLFLKSNTTIISTINIGLHQSSSNAVLLYSDTYSPSLYYKHHIDQIKKIL